MPRIETQRRPEALLLQVLADGRTDHLAADLLERAEVGGLDGGVQRGRVLLEAEALFAPGGCGSRIEDLCSSALAVLLDHLLARHATRSPCGRRPRRPAASNLNDDDGAAREVDAERQPALR